MILISLALLKLR